MPVLGHQFAEHAQELLFLQQLCGMSEEHLHRIVPPAFFREVGIRDTFFLHDFPDNQACALVGWCDIRGLCLCGDLGGGCFCRGFFQGASVHVETAVQVGFAALGDVFFREWFKPLLGAIDSIAGHEDVALGGDAVYIVGDACLLAESLLCLGDGHALGDANPDVELPAGGILDVLHHVLPVAVGVAVHFQSARLGLFHQFLVIYVHTSAIRECLGDDGGLTAVVVSELRVVGT